MKWGKSQGQECVGEGEGNLFLCILPVGPNTSLHGHRQRCTGVGVDQQQEYKQGR